MIILDSCVELWWMASFSFFVCSLLESVLQRGAGRQEEPAWLPCPGCSRLGGEYHTILQAVSCAGLEKPSGVGWDRGTQRLENLLWAGDGEIAEESREQTAWSWGCWSERLLIRTWWEQWRVCCDSDTQRKLLDWEQGWKKGCACRDTVGQGRFGLWILPIFCSLVSLL